MALHNHLGRKRSDLNITPAKAQRLFEHNLVPNLAPLRLGGRDSDSYGFQPLAFNSSLALRAKLKSKTSANLTSRGVFVAAFISSIIG